MAENKQSNHLLEIRDLVIHYETEDGVVEAINRISLDISSGEAVGLVGETGAGKTTIGLAVMGLLPIPPAHIIQGSIRFDGQEITGMTEKQLRKLRGNQISMIFQDPMTALNPTMTVVKQIMEVIKLHNHMDDAQARAHAVKMLSLVGIAEGRADNYPHEFSGGMKQRVVIAMALACNPKLLIADEPTTALDVTIQAQVLQLMKELQDETGTALLVITHDFGIVADICSKCAVIYAGEIVEYGTLEDIFDHRQHPYTIGLFNSIPSLDEDVERLRPIKGLMSDPMNLPSHCSFYDRCDHACEQCKNTDPALTEVTPGHFVKCILARKEN
ncbi:MAG: ABC transporter ATP-binding protein [Lachnospiraceae bacterium]|nr:ABC transporter ATP-binding protein [Lachnospiraceae bacterium]